MRHAPPVGVLSAGDRRWRWLQAALAALAGATIGGWLAAHFEFGGAVQAAAAVAAAIAVFIPAWVLARPRPARLQWDGRSWTLDDRDGVAECMLDLGGWLLLRFRGRDERRARWLALTARDVGPAWHGLRVALYARAAAPEPR